MRKNKLLDTLEPVDKEKMRKAADKYNDAVLKHRANFQAMQRGSVEALASGKIKGLTC